METITFEQTVGLLLPLAAYAGTWIFRQILAARDKYFSEEYKHWLPFISVAIGVALTWGLQFLDQWFGENANPMLVTIWGAFSGALGVSLKELTKQGSILINSTLNK